MEYAVQLENGSFLSLPDGLSMFPTLTAARKAVADFEQEYEIKDGDAVVNLFQVVQASWETGAALPRDWATAKVRRAILMVLENVVKDADDWPNEQPRGKQTELFIERMLANVADARAVVDRMKGEGE